MPHITQIAAVEPKSGAKFNRYVQPKVPVTPEAQQITGIVVSPSGSMTVKGVPVQAANLSVAIGEFQKWITKFPNVLLVAHNGCRFDYPVIMSALHSIGCAEEMCESVSGLIDSLPVFKKVYPQSDCYKQEHLVKMVLGQSYSAYDAMEDVRSLGKLIGQSNIPTERMLGFSFSAKAVYFQLLFNREKAKNMDSLSPLVSRSIVKSTTAENIAGSGLCLRH